MEIIKKILNVILYILIGLLSISVISSFQTTFLGKKYNSVFGYSLFEIKTASMKPAIEIGDWVLVKNTKDVNIKDIITFEQDGDLITHRVIENYKDTFVTKGDSNNIADPYIDREQIVGIVIKILPKFGLIKKTLFNSKVLVLLIVTIVIGCVFFDKKSSEEVSNFFKRLPIFNGESYEQKKEREENERKKAEEQKKKEEQRELKKLSKVLNDVSGPELNKTVKLSKIKVDISNNGLRSLLIAGEEDYEERIEQLTNELNNLKDKYANASKKERKPEKVEIANVDLFEAEDLSVHPIIVVSKK